MPVALRVLTDRPLRKRAVVVALAEAGPAGGGEAALEAFAEGSTYYAALTLETDNCVASPTQMSAHSDLASSHRSVQAPGPAGGGGRGVAGIASQLWLNAHDLGFTTAQFNRSSDPTQ